jgi:N-acetylneuraminic acid mutarotase
MNARNIFKVLVTVFLGAASICQAGEGTWTRKADMPTARAGLSASVVDGKIYAIGGGAPVTTVEQYDPATDTWTKKANMRTPKVFFSTSVVNGKVYAIGGYGSGGAYLSTVEEYDPISDTWTSKSRMPTARHFVSSAVVDGKIYAIGGKISSSTVLVPTVEEYDPATDTWTRKADMPRGRGAMSCSTVDGIIYAIGGTFTGGTGVDQAVPTVEAYDPETDTWTRKADMLTARGFFSTCVVDGRIYAIGGCVNPYNSSELSSVEAYDPATDTWTKMSDMQVRRKALTSAAVNGKIYAIGGQLNAGWDSPLSTVEEYQLIPPPPDFNGNGLVDIKDLLRLIGSWNQDDPTVDVAPFPFGDGIVDTLDLELLMEYWQQPVDDPTLVAHWTLDEMDGVIAYDNAGVNDAVIVGGTEWLPDGGQVDGALQLNGIDGCAITNQILNPADGPFSIFAWIQDGAPGQSVISQFNGVNWLCVNPSWGCLMTELRSSGRGGGPLQSEVVVTDGAWHRIGFVWDGSYRMLYIDDILIAEDTQNGLGSSIGGLNIGCGSNSAAGTFWSGLIDDVRIYNRALRP